RCTHHRHAEIALEVAVAVPIHDGHGRAVLNRQCAQRRCEPADALAKRAIAVAQCTAIRDFLLAMEALRVDQQVLDEQRIGVRRRCRGDEVHRHGLERVVRYAGSYGRGNSGVVIQLDDDVAVGLVNGVGLQAQAARAGHATGGEVEAQAVCRALQYVAIQTPRGERCAVVRAAVVDGMKPAFDVEDDNAATVGEDELALAGGKMAGRRHDDVARHGVHYASS
ncbi:hypothetical protein COLO4_02001, partial [Corchorus olitorius]